ncbi:MAG: hypothetical protein ACYDCK_04530 [Thermoplasmatota archaeon]
MRSAAPFALVLVVASLLAGCLGGPASTIPPPTKPGVFDTSVTENATSASHRFSWQNPDAQATVHFWANLSQGNVVLRMFDSNGLVTFEKRYADTPNGDSTLSTRGAPGTWTITSASSAAKGTWHVLVTPLAS